MIFQNFREKYWREWRINFARPSNGIEWFDLLDKIGVNSMNKMILKSAVAAIAVIGFAGAAQAQSHGGSTSTYSGGALNVFGVHDVSFNDNSFGGAVAGGLWNAFKNNPNAGSRYQQSFDSPDNEDAATASTGAKFTLHGNVTPDCSFYNGGVAAGTAHTIDLGTIGVHTANGDKVSIAFNQMSTAHANVNTATAGCNTKNTVTITKTDMTNTAAGSYDSNQFTNTIPYTIAANWTNASGGHAINLSSTQGSDSVTAGAWRSAFNMDISVPPQQKGLVAGDYNGEIDVTIAATA